jgi:hypothetical protein
VSSPVVHTVTDGISLERTTVRLSPRRMSAGESISVEVLVSGASTTPSGNVALYVDGQLYRPTLTLSPSTGREATASAVLAPLPAGDHVLTAVYAGSPTHAGSSAEVQLRVR